MNIQKWNDNVKQNVDYKIEQQYNSESINKYKHITIE